MELRKLGVWCRVAGVYMGAVGFCDDLLLLALTRDCMQLMLDTCQRFGRRYNLEFSTDPNPEKSKTKCGLAKGKKKPENLVLNGKQFPLVESALHLGHVLHQSGTMDILSKKSTFIDNSVEVRETFGFSSPSEVFQAVKHYVHYDIEGGIPKKFESSF